MYNKPPVYIIKDRRIRKRIHNSAEVMFQQSLLRIYKTISPNVSAPNSPSSTPRTNLNGTGHLEGVQFETFNHPSLKEIQQNVKKFTAKENARRLQSRSNKFNYSVPTTPREDILRLPYINKPKRKRGRLINRRRYKSQHSPELVQVEGSPAPATYDVPAIDS